MPVKFESIEAAAPMTRQPGIAAPNTADLSDKAMAEALATINTVAAEVDAALRRDLGPDEIDLTLGLSVTAGGDIWIANTSVEGAISVTMIWRPRA